MSASADRSTDTSADKAALRATLRERRRRFVAALADRQATEARIAALALGELRGAHRVALYRAHGGEVDPAPLLAALAAAGMATALPFSTARDAPPGFRRWSPGEALADGPFGVRQPAADAEAIVPDAIVVPLLGYDGWRHRLGQGAGWYDRAFALLPEARRIGLAWSIQALDLLPRDPWDVPLHVVVTEEGPR